MSDSVTETPRETTYSRRFEPIQLPRGWERNDFMVRLSVHISDRLMATTIVPLKVKVMLPLIGGMIDTRVYIDQDLYGRALCTCMQSFICRTQL